MTVEKPSAAEEIDAIIAGIDDWRSDTLAVLRRVILSADAGIVEAIKWRKPSKPEGVATWVYDGNVCMADILRKAVRLTFPHGAQVDDPAKLFNARLTSASIRAIDVFEGVDIPEAALRTIVQQAVAFNHRG